MTKSNIVKINNIYTKNGGKTKYISFCGFIPGEGIYGDIEEILPCSRAVFFNRKGFDAGEKAVITTEEGKKREYIKSVIFIARRRFLTAGRKKQIKGYLEKYLEGIIKGEEYLDTFDKVIEDCGRVELCERYKYLNIRLVMEYLQGLPVGIEFETYSICLMLLEAAGFERNMRSLRGFEEFGNLDELDSFYWNTLAQIILEKGWKQGE